MGKQFSIVALLCGIGFSFLNPCYKNNMLRALLLQAVDLLAVTWNQACGTFIPLLV